MPKSSNAVSEQSHDIALERKSPMIHSETRCEEPGGGNNRRGAITASAASATYPRSQSRCAGGTLLDSLFHTIESACIWMTRRLLERVKPTVVHISICRAARSSSARLEVVLARSRQAGDSFRFRHTFNVCVPLPETTKLIPVTTPLKLESL